MSDEEEFTKNEDPEESGNKFVRDCCIGLIIIIIAIIGINWAVGELGPDCTMINTEFDVPSGLSLPDNDVSHTAYLKDNNYTLSITENVNSNAIYKETDGQSILSNTNKNVNGVNVNIIQTNDNDKYLSHNYTYYSFTKNNIRYLIKSDTGFNENKVFEIIGNIKKKS